MPEAPNHILTLQHLAQQVNNHHHAQEGTGAITTSKTITLFWGQRKFSKTVVLDPCLNIGITTTSCGIKAYCSFHATIGQEMQEINIFKTHVIAADTNDLDNENTTKDDNLSIQPLDLVQMPEQHPTSMTSPQTDPGEHKDTPTSIQEPFHPLSHEIPDNPELSTMDPRDKLLCWHHHLGHLLFKRIL